MMQDVTQFEARQLKPYAEPVTAEELKVASVYFSVQFMDEKLLVPTVEPWIFLGKNLRSEDIDSHYFQTFGSYSEGIRLDDDCKDGDYCFQVASTNGMNHIFEYERALDVLMRSALRRRKSSDV
jgi:hypothetical protein